MDAAMPGFHVSGRPEIWANNVNNVISIGTNKPIRQYLANDGWLSVISVRDFQVS